MPSPALPLHLATRTQWGRTLHLIAGSQGSVGFPRQHPNHHFVVVEGTDRGQGYQGYMSVDYAYTALMTAGLATAARRLDAATGISSYSLPFPPVDEISSPSL